MRQRPRLGSASHRRSVTAVSTRGHHRVTVIGAGPAGSPETKGLIVGMRAPLSLRVWIGTAGLNQSAAQPNRSLRHHAKKYLYLV